MPRFRAGPARQRTVPGTAPFVPSTIDVGNTVPVTGSVTASITGSVTVTVPNPVTVSGTVTVSGITATASVLVTNFPASQTVSGTVTVSNLPPATQTVSGTINFASLYPATATSVISASGNVANATASATLAGVAAKTTYISGFEVTGAGATVGLPVVVTVTGLTTTLSYIYSAIAGALLANTPLLVAFSPPLPASGVSTSIVVSCPPLGLGNTNNAVVARGYQV